VHRKQAKEKRIPDKNEDVKWTFKGIAKQDYEENENTG